MINNSRQKENVSSCTGNHLECAVGCANRGSGVLAGVACSGPRDKYFGFRFSVSGFGLQVASFEFRVAGFEFRVSSFEFRVSCFAFSVSGFGFRVSGFEFRVQNFVWQPGPGNARKREFPSRSVISSATARNMYLC